MIQPQPQPCVPLIPTCVPLIPPADGAAAVVTQAIPARTSLANLARRQRNDAQTWRQMRQAYTITQLPGRVHDDGIRDLIRVQDAWDAYRANVRELASPQFWNFFLPLHTLSTTAIDLALGNAKKVFLQRNTAEWGTFFSSRRKLFDKIKTVRDFWEECMHTYIVDLSQFDLASGTKCLTFKFIDPLWGWLVAARRQHPLDMHWKSAMSGMNPSYGGGVQYGKCFHHACRSVPPGTYVMAVSLHWDGTSTHRGLASTPICVGVSNCNNSDTSTQFCVGYMPKVPDDSPEYRAQPLSTRVKFYIRQQCIGAILRVFESVAEKGITCRLRNQLGLQVQRVLVPRLFAMNLDQPEAQLFFGMLNRCSCSKCIRRKGYSAFRSSRPQSQAPILRLYHIAQNGGRNATKAQEKLRRWGFHPDRVCCLLTECDKFFVKLPGVHEVFPCVDYRDRLHGLIIFIHRSITNTLDGLSKQTLGGPTRRILDRRLKYICGGSFLRDPVTQRAFRSQQSIFSEVGMTATDRKCAIFHLAHVLGPGAELLHQNIRTPMLTCIAHAQLLLIAASGARMYTKQELEVIFDRGYKVVFGSLQAIRDFDYNVRVEHHTRYPDTTSAPLPHKRPSRFNNAL